jgi:phosphatidylethanolamine N-methyltransferase
VLAVDKSEHPHDATDVYRTTTHIVAKSLDLDPAVVPASARYLVDGKLSAERARYGIESSEGTTKHVDGLDKGKKTDISLSEIELVDPENDFILYSADDANRIAYAIKVAFDVELDKDVVVAAANVTKLVSRILEARRLLRPGDAGTTMKADFTEG